MSEPLVTVVCVPRDHFSHAKAALESVLELTSLPYRLVYVDGGSPLELRDYLRARSEQRGFELLRTEYYLSPNRARNLGLQRARTRYVVFIDNDVIVAPGWLEPLVDCAEQTGAWVVGPLNCEGEPLHETVHFAGGDCRIEETETDGRKSRRLVDRIHLQKRRVADTRKALRRSPTEVAEFHCMLVRRAIFDQVGTFDEKMLSTRENLDFCLLVQQAGGSIYLEPDSVITYLAPIPLRRSDWPFFLLRWSDAWDRSSFDHLRRKWDLDLDRYFQVQYRALGWRRRQLWIKPLLRPLPSRALRRGLQMILNRLDRLLNRWIVRRYERRQARLLDAGRAAGA